MTSGSSLTKLAALTSHSGARVPVGVECARQWRRGRKWGQAGGSAGGKDFPPSLPGPPPASPCAGLRVGTRLYWSRAPQGSCPRRCPGLARVRLSPPPPPPSSSARLFPPSLRAPARLWLGHGSLRRQGGVAGAVVFRRCEGHCLEGQRHPRRRADSSRASHHLHVNLPPPQKGNR